MKIFSINKAIFLLILLGTVSQPGLAQYSVYDFDPVTVTGSRIPSPLSSTLRTITVIDRQTISASGAEDVSSLIESIAGVDVRSQGPNDVQSDISIRGAGSEQTLILIDGVKLSDPQTAHHNMDLPVSLENIEQIEIIKGSGSKLYGANAFGGVINIVTRKETKPSMQLSADAGNFGYYRGSGLLSFRLRNLSNQLSINTRHADGYRFNTDFDDLNLFYKSTLNYSKIMFDFSGAYRYKDFGANNFYFVNQANQRENTRTLFLNFKGNLPIENGWLSAGINWRRHFDHYIYNYENPALYENQHTTNVIQADIQGTIEGKRLTQNAGIDLGQEFIHSNRLGNHQRQYIGFIYENRLNSPGPLNLQIGASGYYYSHWGWNLMPGLDLKYQISDRIFWSGSAGRAFRIPTFTELYYIDPSNLGNPDLRPERGWTIEQNLIRKTQNSALTAGIFYRYGIDQIDWIRSTDNDPWQVRNITKIQNYGFESSAAFRLPGSILEQLSVSYSFLKNRRFTGSNESKYLLSSLRNQLIVSLIPLDFWGVRSSWTLRYEDRLNYDSYVIFDVNLTKSFNRISISISGKNLLNSDYADFTGIPMPGRWMTVKISYLWQEPHFKQ